MNYKRAKFLKELFKQRTRYKTAKVPNRTKQAKVPKGTQQDNTSTGQNLEKKQSRH